MNDAKEHAARSDDGTDANTVLIIDDNADVIRQISLMIRDQARVLFATSGDIGLAMALRHKPQIVLLDVEMANMNGFEVCSALQGNAEMSGTAIIFVTGNADVASEVACLDAGAVDFISKPLQPAIVRARVRTHLRLQDALRKLEVLSTKDGLTGIYNRRYFDTQLAVEFARHRRQQSSLGLAFVDIDHFKQFNDAYGHQAGDVALQQVATGLEQITRRPGDFVCRYGGEEFVIVLPYASKEGLRDYAAKLCAHIRSQGIAHPGAGAGGVLTVSVGLCAAIPVAEQSPLDLIQAADQALYRAKQQGRDGFAFQDI